MHFTGMTAATLAFDPLTSLAEPSGIERQSLAIFVAAVALLLLGIGMASAVVDGYLADRNALEAERLRRYVGELEATRHAIQRSEERRIGQECVCTCRSRAARYISI